MTEITDEEFLRLAIKQSALAAQRGDYPYGAALVHNGKVVLSGYNTTLSTKDITAHAELKLIKEAGQKFGETFLSESTLYSSCEPCIMCQGAIYWSGIRKLVYGCSTELDAKISEMPFAIPCRQLLTVKEGHTIEIKGPLLEENALVVLQNFWPAYLSKNRSSFGLNK